MELEDRTTKLAYIQLLAETLRKKSDILEKLMNLTEQQDEIISSEDFKEEEFLQTITLKDELIEALAKLDDGFEKLYERVKEELTLNKALYKEEIIKLQETVTVITDLSVKLQVQEKRNKVKLEVLFSRKRKDIKNTRLSSQTAASYYKTMAKQQESQSIFYDKKN